MLNFKALWSTIKNINWREFNILDVVHGCASNWLTDVHALSKIGKLDTITKVAKYRLSICVDCEIFNDGICDIDRIGTNVETGEEVNGCGCVLKCKTALLDQVCPLYKWRAYKENGANFPL